MRQTLRIIGTRPKPFLLICAAFSLVGCKGPDFNQRYISIGVARAELDTHVPIYGGLRYGLKSDNWMSPGFGGVLADMIVNKIEDKRLAAMEQTMSRAQIRLSEMLRARFLEHIAKIANLVPSDGDAVFQLEILQHGVAEPNPFGNQVVPAMQVRARLVRRDGKSLWEKNSRIYRRSNPGVGATMEQYAADPEKLRRDWETQTELAVEALLK